MAESMKELLRKAYRDKGLDLPAKKTSDVASAKKRSKHKARKNASGSEDTHPLGQTTSGSHVAQPASAVRPPRGTTRPISINSPTIQPTRTRPTAKSAPRPTADEYSIHVAEAATLAFEDRKQKESRLLDADFLQNHATQCHGPVFRDEREIALGLDFGTSSVKVVIGDSALGAAFAVPFTAEDGIGRYLLPCCVYETHGIFSLRQGQRDYRDLKLSLIANPTDFAFQNPVIAFLASVIRYARAWLFREHADKYRNTRIFWGLKIGLPVAYHLDQSLSHIFAKIAQIAWLVANTPGEITTSVIDSTRRCDDEATNSVSSQQTAHDEVQIDVIPEIAAQIYGFVKSNKFDRYDKNLYLMVDVGAGTVDSSLFQVKPGKGGRWDFEFFTSVVEPLGVMNLHRHRVNWWQAALKRSAATRGRELLPSLELLKYQTDREIAIPDCYSRYFYGIKVDFTDPGQSPDSLFFGDVREQVGNKTYWKTWHSGLLTQDHLRNTPTFYCGGGARMRFYERLRHELRSDPNCSWLSAIPRQIEYPKMLKAPGLDHKDFDRLTVAYGLSFLDVGKIIKAIPQPKQINSSSDNWRQNYIDKDQC